MIIRQTMTALGPNARASFQASGGVEPYLYEILPGGAGGSINASTGVFVAPGSVSYDPRFRYTVIQATDYDGATSTARILVGSPLLLFCEILQRELGLAEGRVYLWNQKIMQPIDSGLYIAVSIPFAKPFANNNRAAAVGSDLQEQQYVSMMATLDIDIISRSEEALYRKEEVLLALASTYSEQQQTANGFYIAKLPPGAKFLNLSQIDGAAIPYRFKISINMQYCYSKAKAVSFYDDFEVDSEVDA